MIWSKNTLSILNLSDTEITILNALHTPHSVQEIASLTSLSRTGINYAIKRLLKDELIRYSLRGKRRFYTSISEEDLIKKISHTIDQIQIHSTHKQGTKVKLSHKDEFIIHVGPEEIVPAFKRIAVELKNDRVKALQHHISFNDQAETASPRQVSDFNQTIIRNKIIIDGLLNESAYTSYTNEIRSNPSQFKAQIESLGGRMADYAVFPDTVFKHHAEIWIFKTTTLIINWKDKVAIEITNENMTNLLRDMFEYVKQSSSKIDHNRLMRELLEKYQ